MTIDQIIEAALNSQDDHSDDELEQYYNELEEIV